MVALPTCFEVLLEDEHEAALVECPEPLVPAHVLQPLAAVPGEVEGQDAQVTVVLRAGLGAPPRLSCQATVISM